MEVKSYSPTRDKPAFKKTDFRYKLWVKDRKALRQKSKKQSFRVEVGKPPKGKGLPTVETSKGKSNVDVLRLCLRDLNIREFPFGRRDGKGCDLYWHGVSFYDNGELPSGKVNKFPGMSEILRKVNLGRMLETFEKLYPDEFDFHPQSWFLPQQFAEFSDAIRRLKEKDEKPVFIIKPDEGSQGDGIYLVHEAREYLMGSDRHHIAQRYIANPMLIDDLKFDFRVYVVLLSVDPLEIHISKEGLARFCTVPYEPPTMKNLCQSFMHLTNYSLNKRSSTYQHTNLEDDGSKRTMSSVLKILEQKGYDVSRMWAQIEMLVVKTIIAIVPELKVELKAQKSSQKVGPTCFQILGFDILLTEDARPVLLEVNANPSLRIDFEQEVFPGINEYIHSPVDEEIKRPLVSDCLRLVLPQATERHRGRRQCAVAKRRNKFPYSGKKKDSEGHVEGHVEGHIEGDANDDDADEVVSGDDSDEESDINSPNIDTVSHGQRETTLSKIYPDKYSDDFEWLRVLDRAASIFIYCVGIRGTLRMGSTGFRSFTRKCKLTNSGCGFNNAVLDIMFIDLLRRWDHSNSDKAGGNGLCFQGFVEAFFQISAKRFPGLSILEAVEGLLQHSEASIAEECRNNTLPRIVTKTTQKQPSSAHNRTKPGGGDGYFIDYKVFSVEQLGKSKGKGKTISKGGSAKADSALSSDGQ